jgi:hypothetical protein
MRGVLIRAFPASELADRVANEAKYERPDDPVERYAEGNSKRAFQYDDSVGHL